MLTAMENKNTHTHTPHDFLMSIFHLIFPYFIFRLFSHQRRFNMYESGSRVKSF